MEAVIAATKTAPAEISFAYFAPGCSLSVKTSTIFSIAVLVSSTATTKPITKIIIIQSVGEIFKKKESPITARAIRKWIFRFGSCLSAVYIPSKACLNERMWNFLEPMILV